MAGPTCEQCGARLENSLAVCPSCHALQPFDPSLSFFAVLGVAEDFCLDPKALRDRALNLQQALHPDRFAAAAGGLRRRSLEWSTRVNEALAVLGDPLRRGGYLFQERFGSVPPGEDQGTIRDPELLLRQMECRERLEEAVSGRDREMLDGLRAEVLAGERHLEAFLASAFAGPEENQAGIGRALLEWQYLRRLRTEIDRYEDQWDFA